MLKRLHDLLCGPSPITAQILEVIDNLRCAEKMAREKGYEHAADRIRSIADDLERQYGHDPR